MTGGQAVQLREGADVTVFVDAADVSISCRILAFHRRLIVVTHAAGAVGQDVRVLRPGVTTYIVCDNHGQLAALRVKVVKVSDERLVLEQLDTFALGQRRSFTRLDASIPIALEGLRADGSLAPEVHTTTLDFSAGGARVLRTDELGEHVGYRAALELPGHRRPLVCGAHLVRADRVTLALRFAGMSVLDESHIARHVLEALSAGAPRVMRTASELIADTLLDEDPQARIDALVAGARPQD